MDGEKEGNKLAEEPLTKAEVTLLFGIFFTAGYSASKKTLWGPMPPVEPRLLPHLVASTTGDHHHLFGEQSFTFVSC